MSIIFKISEESINLCSVLFDEKYNLINKTCLAKIGVLKVTQLVEACVEQVCLSGEKAVCHYIEKATVICANGLRDQKLGQFGCGKYFKQLDNLECMNQYRGSKLDSYCSMFC